METKKEKLGFWNIIGIVVVTLYGLSIIYIGHQNDVKIRGLEKELKETKTAELKIENEELKMEIDRVQAFYDGCEEQTEWQWNALFLWRSGYLTPSCESVPYTSIDYELGLAQQIVTHPNDFREELAIINSLNEKEKQIEFCLEDRMKLIKELQAVYSEIEQEADPESYEKILDKVQDAIRIKSSNP